MSGAAGGFGFEDGWFTFRYVEDGVEKVARFAAGNKSKESADQRQQLLRDAYPQLKQWAADAAATNTAWPTLTQQQKDAEVQKALRRLGLFFDFFTQLLAALNADV